MARAGQRRPAHYLGRAPADIAVPGDYNGDGTADPAVFRPATGTWYIKDQLVTVGRQQGDVPVPLDRTGDGRAEIGVYRRRTGQWYFRDLTAGALPPAFWGGAPGDVPIGRGMFQWNTAFGRIDRDFDHDDATT